MKVAVVVALLCGVCLGAPANNELRKRELEVMELRELNNILRKH